MPTPYAGNASNYPTDVNILSGSDVPNTATFNTAYEGTLDRTAYNNARIPSPAQNWYPEMIGGSSQFQCACPIEAVGTLQPTALATPATWMYITQSSSKLQATLTGGLDGAAGGSHLGTFFGVDGGTATGAACCQDSGGTPWCVNLGTVSATQTLYVNGWNGSTWQVAQTVTSFTGSTSGPVAMCNLGATVIYGVPIINAGDTYVVSSSNGFNTTSKTTFTASSLGGVGGFADMLLKSNGSQVLAVPSQTPMGATPSYYTTPDGVTWTQQTFTGITFNTTDRIEGLCWYALAAVWVLAIQTNWGTSPATTAFYSSPDGINWTKIANGPTHLYIADLEVIANALVCTMQDGNAAAGASGSEPSGQIFSDDNGVTWRLSGEQLLANAATSTTGYTRSRLVSGPTGLFTFNTANARWSHACGLPPALT